MDYEPGQIDEDDPVISLSGHHFAEAAAGLLLHADQSDERTMAKARTYAILALAYATADRWR